MWHHNQGTSTLSHSSVHSVTPFDMGTTRCWTPFLGHLEFDFFTLNLWPASIETEFERKLLCLHCPQVIQSYGFFPMFPPLTRSQIATFRAPTTSPRRDGHKNLDSKLTRLFQYVLLSLITLCGFFWLVHCWENIVGFLCFNVYVMLILKKSWKRNPMQDFLRVPRQAFVDSKPRYTGLSTAATPSKATRHWQKREIVWTSGGMFINMFHCLTDVYSFFAVPGLYE